MIAAYDTDKGKYVLADNDTAPGKLITSLMIECNRMEQMLLNLKDQFADDWLTPEQVAEELK
jgi:hypothetical protein